jgi:predicted nuclease with TOPRIM domain
MPVPPDNPAAYSSSDLTTLQGSHQHSTALRESFEQLINEVSDSTDPANINNTVKEFSLTGLQEKRLKAIQDQVFFDYFLELLLVGQWASKIGCAWNTELLFTEAKYYSEEATIRGDRQLLVKTILEQFSPRNKLQCHEVHSLLPANPFAVSELYRKFKALCSLKKGYLNQEDYQIIANVYSAWKYTLTYIKNLDPTQWEFNRADSDRVDRPGTPSSADSYEGVGEASPITSYTSSPMSHSSRLFCSPPRRGSMLPNSDIEDDINGIIRLLTGSNLDEQKALIQEALRRLASSITQLNTDYEELRAKFSEIQEREAAWVRDQGELERDINRLAGELEQKAGDIQSRDQEIEALHTAHQMQEDERRKLNQEYKQVQTDFLSTKQEHGTLLVQYEDLKQRFERQSADYSALINQYKQLEISLKQSRMEHEARDERDQHIKDYIKTLRVPISQELDYEESVIDQICALSQQLQSAEHKCKIALQTASSLNTNMDALRAEHAQLQKRWAFAVTSLQSKTDQLLKDIALCKLTPTLAKDTLKHLERHWQALAQYSCGLEETICEYQEKIADMYRQIPLSQGLSSPKKAPCIARPWASLVGDNPLYDQYNLLQGKGNQTFEWGPYQLCIEQKGPQWWLTLSCSQELSGSAGYGFFSEPEYKQADAIQALVQAIVEHATFYKINITVLGNNKYAQKFTTYLYTHQALYANKGWPLNLTIVEENNLSDQAKQEALRHFCSKYYVAGDMNFYQCNSRPIAAC